MHYIVGGSAMKHKLGECTAHCAVLAMMGDHLPLGSDEVLGDVDAAKPAHEDKLRNCVCLVDSSLLRCPSFQAGFSILGILNHVAQRGPLPMKGIRLRGQRRSISDLGTVARLPHLCSSEAPSPTQAGPAWVLCIHVYMTPGRSVIPFRHSIPVVISRATSKVFHPVPTT